MSAVEDRLAELGLTVPEVVPPVAAYIPAVRSGNLVFSSGQIPMRGGSPVAVGKVGAPDGPSAELATEAAQQCALNAIAAVMALIGDLDQVKQVVKAVVFVASDPSFTGQPAVANGASELLATAFDGPHARSAVGVAALPLDVSVEVEIIVEL
ncbi:RidA family protein [Nocardioides sp. Kera G14]|uniref:RidA family protein n=1 Tax=Nocardioides sp. Kera G14 TaxID=2884264 RepID=UPI001D113CC7|nr:RidA family protein [Nocardioides sp. Kera G14]UDY23747.1 RidA family protein [Nocardioides sp. Kera G14]